MRGIACARAETLKRSPMRQGRHFARVLVLPLDAFREKPGTKPGDYLLTNGFPGQPIDTTRVNTAPSATGYNAHLSIRTNMRMRSTIRGVTAAAASFAVTTALFAAPLAYVPNEGSGTVSVIDTETDAVIKEIPAGKKPRGIATGKSGNSLYVSDQPHNALLVIDLDKQEVTDRIDLGESPEGVGISADGKWVAAAVEISNAVALIDTSTNKRVATIKVEGKIRNTQCSAPMENGSSSAPKKPRRSTSSISRHASKWRTYRSASGHGELASRPTAALRTLHESWTAPST